MMSPMTSMWPAPGVFVARLRQAHADRRVGDRRAEDRHVGAVGGGQDAVARRSSSRGARRAGRGTRATCTAARSSVSANVGDPLVVVDRTPPRSRRCRRRDRCARPAAPRRPRAASRRSGAGRASRADRDRGSRRSRPGSRRSGASMRCATTRRRPPALSAPAMPRKIVHVVAEHLLPDAARGREVAALKRDPLHPREHLVRRRAPARPRTARRARRKRDFLVMRRHSSNKAGEGADLRTPDRCARRPPRHPTGRSDRAASATPAAAVSGSE